MCPAISEGAAKQEQAAAGWLTGLNIHAQKTLVLQKEATVRTVLRHLRMKATETLAAGKEILIGCDPGVNLSRIHWDRTSKVAGCAKVRTLVHGTKPSI